MPGNSPLRLQYFQHRSPLNMLNALVVDQLLTVCVF